MCAATDKATVLVGVVFGSVAALLMPASASLLSRSTAAWEQVRTLPWQLNTATVQTLGVLSEDS